MATVYEKLNAITQLKKGWDSHGAGEICITSVEFATDVWAYLCGTVPVPVVAPLRNGGVQFEWEIPGGYIEAEFDFLTVNIYATRSRGESTVTMEGVNSETCASVIISLFPKED